jgi:hypothetical protein
MSRRTPCFRRSLAVDFLIVAAAVVVPQGCDTAHNRPPPARSLEQVMRAVVEVRSPGGHGTGFLAFDRSTVVTNFHVIEGQENLTVRFANDEEVDVDGYLVASPRYDLAILHLPQNAPLGEPLRLSTEALEVGSEVAAVGSPQGLQGTVTKGVVSGYRSWPEIAKALGAQDAGRRKRYAEDSEWVQTSAPTSRGNSGGPLVNAGGDVVGINTWQLSAASGQNLNFSLSAEHVQMLASTLPSMKVRSLSTLPSDGGGARASSENRDGLSRRTHACWNTQANVIGNWYARSSIVVTDLWRERKDEESEQQRRRRVIDQLRGCSRRSYVNVEQLGRIRKGSVAPLLGLYIDGLAERLTAISDAYAEAAKTYADVVDAEDEDTRDSWLAQLISPQERLNEFINVKGAACQSRLAFDFGIQLGAPIAFTPAECVSACIREASVPADIFTAVFTGSPRGYLLPTYEQHKATDAAEHILLYATRALPKDSEFYKWALTTMQERSNSRATSEGQE